MRTEARAKELNGIPLLHYAVFFVMSPVLLAWDLYSKWYVFETLGYEHRQSGPWFAGLWGKETFRLMTSFNHGALWGMGQGLSFIFALLSVVAVLAVLYWLFLARGAKSLWLTVALSLVMGGTLGNLYDRLGLHGLRDEVSGQIYYAVRDFLFFRINLGFMVYEWPIFNFADTFLVTGAIMLLIQSFQADAAAKPASDVIAAQPANGHTA